MENIQEVSKLGFRTGDDLKFSVSLLCCAMSANSAENTAQHLLLLIIRVFDCLLMLLDLKEDVRLQPPVMETDSGVNDGNYCMVYSATILTSAINITHQA